MWKEPFKAEPQEMLGGSNTYSPGIWMSRDRYNTPIPVLESLESKVTFFYPRLTSFLPSSVQFLGYFEVTSRSRGQYEDPLNLCRICCLSEEFGKMLLIQVVQSDLLIPQLEVNYPFKGSLHHSKRVTTNCQDSET